MSLRRVVGSPAISSPVIWAAGFAFELGLPEAECLVADPRYSLVVQAK
jgi:hypothetical protein